MPRALKTASSACKSSCLRANTMQSLAGTPSVCIFCCNHCATVSSSACKLCAASVLRGVCRLSRQLWQAWLSGLAVAGKQLTSTWPLSALALLCGLKPCISQPVINWFSVWMMACALRRVWSQLSKSPPKVSRTMSCAAKNTRGSALRKR